MIVKGDRESAFDAALQREFDYVVALDWPHKGEACIMTWTANRSKVLDWFCEPDSALLFYSEGKS